MLAKRGEYRPDEDGKNIPDQTGIIKPVRVSLGGTVYYQQCIYDSTGQGINGVSITYSPSVVEYSGGHDHPNSTGSGRPQGYLQPTMMSTSADGCTPTGQWWAPPELVAGIYYINYSHIYGSESIPLNVMYDIDLYQVPPSSWYKLHGETPTHFHNHYTPDWLHAWLEYLGNQFYQRTGGQNNQCVNDTSLVWGGRFDINSNWDAPHSEHLDGRQADISYYPKPWETFTCLQPKKELYLQILQENGFGNYLDEPTKNHVHARF